MYDNNKKKDGPQDGNNKGDVKLASNDNMKLIYFLIRTIALYTMLCLRPILILSILMIYRGFKEAFVYAEITYLNLVYRPANEKQSILYAIKYSKGIAILTFISKEFGNSIYNNRAL